MSRTMVIRYRTHPEAADENVRLVGEVYAALAELGPAGFHYATFRLADEVSFVHLAHYDGDADPLPTLAAFAEFQRELGGRCAEMPAVSQAVVVGSYGMDGVTG